MVRWSKAVLKNKWLYIFSLIGVILLRIFVYNDLNVFLYDLLLIPHFVLGEYFRVWAPLIILFTIYWLFIRKRK